MEPRPPRLWFAGAVVVVRVEASDSDGRLGAWESEEPLGTALPMHIHTREDEQLMLFDGAITCAVGDQVHHLQAGDTLALPRDVPHAHRVTSTTARIFTVATPGGFERLFTDLGVPAGQDTTPPPTDTAVLAEAVARLGVRIVGPPLNATAGGGVIS